MKKVLLNKRKYSWRDGIRVLSLLFIHAFAFVIYLGIVLSFKGLFTGSFSISPAKIVFLFIYPLSTGIIVNVLLHIIYSEKGSEWWRLIMWLHSGFIAILIPIMIIML